MKTKNPRPSADFEYAEFSGDICCPFCGSLLISKPLSALPKEDDNEDAMHRPDGDPDFGNFCKHVGFWSVSAFPSVNDNWRKEMFLLAKEIKSELPDGEDGYYWQETLQSAVGDTGDGGIGYWAARAIPDFQVTLYRQFAYDHATSSERYMNYMAIIIRKKRPPKALKRATSRGV